MTKAPSPRTRVRRLHDKAAYDLDTIHAILDAMPVAHVGHLIDGFPVVTPTLQWREGDHIYWHGSSASRMTRAATGGPVCVTVTLTDAMVLSRSGLEHSVNYRCVMVMGTAQAVTDPALKARHLETMMEQMFPGRWPQLRPMTAQELKATAILTLPLNEASAKVSAAAPGDSDPAEDKDWPVWAGNLPITLTMGAPQPATDLAPGIPLPDHAAGYRFGKAPK
ncbi:pyridoxamine 5'-phosphate oxidase family protein [Fuscibacter oryzae]|uniref:Pyridoxamine 5'-phosphate oxidase family protein n=1 Tax=Fuscibacter oryzae TaxID=2803939 RepID=A0A8J7STR0_9RHOB|nr:pyridoxamine 5'-phosphate oxidase family protein [Fuscibacter oryzae]MBL4926806.1 pyridoxamine 5'-phosphate oxidase family protein [Fuscibacter oryzae]